MLNSTTGTRAARRDWYAWMLREIRAADFVIVVASPGYRAVGDGTQAHDSLRGVQAEAAVLRDLLYGDRETWLGRVLPVVLPGQSLDELTAFTQPHSASHFVMIPSQMTVLKPCCVCDTVDTHASVALPQ